MKIKTALSGYVFFRNRANRENKTNNAKNVIIAVVLTLAITGCGIFEETTRRTINAAVGAAVEQELGPRLDRYSDVMMYQLVYTQAFYMGGFGFSPGAFEEGQGATWRIEAIEAENISSYTAERALLKRLDDGSMWWYLKFDADEADPVEFEVLLTEGLAALEMYIKDPETGEVRHHEFARDEQERAEIQEGEASIEEIGYMTGHFHVEDRSLYRQERETISTGAGSFDTELLIIAPEDFADFEDLEEGEGHPKNMEYRWWLAEGVPGELVRFEYRDLDDDSMLRGEMISLRDDYRARFADL